MFRRKRNSQESDPRPSRGRRVAVFAAVLLALVAVALLARGTAASRTRAAAAEHLQAGAVAAAERSIGWAERLDPGDARNDLLHAACHRSLGHQQAWEGAVDSAERKGARGEPLNRELRLGRLRFGSAGGVSPDEFEQLVQAGAPPRESATAVVYGLLAIGDFESAEELVSNLSASDPAHAGYLRAVSLWSMGEPEPARAGFEEVLEGQPRNEVVRTGLAMLLEETGDLTAARSHYAALTATAPGRESATLGLSRTLRKLGSTQDAGEVLRPLTSSGAVSRALAIELAEIEYERGNYAEARQWFARADLNAAHTAETLRTAATTLALEGKTAEAEQLFARVDNAQDLARQSAELRRRLMTDPGDTIAAEEMRRLQSSPAAASHTARGTRAVSPLYVRHCSACHGADGDGAGRAARHLYPRPRSFRAGEFRLVSTLDGIPALDDIERVIRLGMPGTSMPSFDRLSAVQRRELALEVRQFHREGTRQRIIEQMREDGEAIDEDQLVRIIADLTTPGDRLPIPEIGPATEQSIARGRALYDRMACRNCHGAEGTGDSELALFDGEGRPVIARDLVRDPMKGGPEPESLYKRLRLGMPGTPHPANPALVETDLVSLVHFCLSLSAEPKRNRTNHERAMQALGMRFHSLTR